ncbi:Gfo/Idh/MocA family protein [Zhihengliuella halotolerans]|uniref:Putative dehydrogenase n=1 Tax=Zhihengliuella halotolerans TaxID=370736 RepID=A0A4Q8AGJ7_9MICC|nr:Gfo/Idh/MocA family oxidoreductase [Zhihengliuella halotolerans]RZU62789.1 putative dehydrogenase [Zhihengliuella halotolerans]
MSGTQPDAPRVRVGIIGAGGIATGAHIPALRTQAHRAEIVAIADVDADRAAAAAAEHSIAQHYTSVDALLAGAEPDLIVVCTPPGAHRDAVMSGLRAGAWVWCEKPPMLSLAEYDEVAALEGEQGPYAAYVFQHRFGPAANRVRAAVDDGSLGDPHVAVCNTLWYRGHDYYDVPWRGKWETEGGGPAMGHGIHQMDLLLDILGDWTEVTAIADTLDRDLETEDVSLAMVRFASGAVASIVNSVLSPRETSYLRFDFTDATVEVEHLYGYASTDWRFTPSPHLAAGGAQDDDGARKASSFFADDDGGASSHVNQISALLDSMERGERPRASGDDGRKSLEFIAALYESAETGRTVRRADLKRSGPYYLGMHDPAYTYQRMRRGQQPAAPSRTDTLEAARG